MLQWTYQSHLSSINFPFTDRKLRHTDMMHVICGDTKDSDSALYNKASLSLPLRLVRLHLYPQN